MISWIDWFIHYFWSIKSSLQLKLKLRKLSKNIAFCKMTTVVLNDIIQSLESLTRLLRSIVHEKQTPIARAPTKPSSDMFCKPEECHETLTRKSMLRSKETSGHVSLKRKRSQTQSYVPCRYRQGVAFFEEDLQQRVDPIRTPSPVKIFTKRYFHSIKRTTNGLR